MPVTLSVLISKSLPGRLPKDMYLYRYYQILCVRPFRTMLSTQGYLYTMLLSVVCQFYALTINDCSVLYIFSRPGRGVVLPG
jgi:hypothetical protein